MDQSIYSTSTPPLCFPSPSTLPTDALPKIYNSIASAKQLPAWLEQKLWFASGAVRHFSSFFWHDSQAEFWEAQNEWFVMGAMLQEFKASLQP